MKKNTIRLHNSLKHYTFDQDKVCDPVETVKRFKDRLKEVNLDILREVKRIDSGRLDIPVYFSVCGKDAHDIIGTKKQMGKGSTPEQSQASACMELAERFSFFSFIKNPDNFILATYSEMKKSGEPLMPLEQLLHSVHDEKNNVTILEELIKDIPMQWTWANSLTSGKDVLVPFSWFFAINEFNGPSAGNSYEEAICQGISEIVERHVCALITHNRIKAPAVDLNSVKEQVSRQLLSKFTKNGISVYINDFSLDTGIPTIGAMAIDHNNFPESSEIVYTAGTTPNPDKALIRALTEVAQLAGDFHTNANYVASGLPKPLSLEEMDYITHPGKTINLEDMPDLADDDIKVEVENMVAALQERNMEVFVINTMHDRLQIPAIYTIVPGAHFRERSMINDVGLFAAKLVAERTPDPQEANIQLDRMQEILHDTYYLEFYIGRNLHSMGNYDEAMERLQKALNLNPEEEDIPYIYSYMGSCLKDQGKFKEAAKLLKTGLTYDEERPDIHNLLGVCYFKQDEFKKAITHFTRAVELNPSSAMDYANLGVNYRKLGEIEQAIKYFKRALSMDPDIEFAKTQLAEITA